MSRIDAVVGSQVGDIVRPAQSQREGQIQVQHALLASQRVESATPPPADDLRAVAGQLKQVIEAASGRRLAFTIDDSTDTVVATVSDKVSGEVIKQIPTEAILRMREHLSEMVGNLVDEQA